MKRSLITAAAVMLLISCSSQKDKGKFTLNGELKGAADQKIYLEQLFFSEKDPEVLDTAEIKNGKFSLTTLAPEEGLYRIRLEKDKAPYFFINDNSVVSFHGDINAQDLKGWSFSGAANSSLKNVLAQNDSIRDVITSAYSKMKELQQAKVSETDSTLLAATTTFNEQKEALNKFCFQYADTAKSPMVALFAATMAQVEIDKLQLPVDGLVKRFPHNNSIATAASFIKVKTAQMLQGPSQDGSDNPGLAVGSVAPPINMNDVNDKPFTLAQLRGKYVLIDFWASWCGPCRGENPNVVAAYNEFKNKNFTVLGVSLDDKKDKWKEAIAADKLTWTHVSDMAGLNNSPITNTYGFNSIPFNVLIDPEGKVVACGLRGPLLQEKLSEVLK